MLDMNKHLIGPEILSLAEDDVPPEDLIFHKFHMNKMSTSTKLKKKKEAAEEVEAEGLYGGAKSDNKEIENLLDATEPSLESDGESDYDDLDNVANEDDDALIGNASDNETYMDVLSDGGEADDDVPTFDDIDIRDADDASDDDDDDDIHIGDVDDEDEDDDDDDVPMAKKGKKSGKKPLAPPFASLEEYEHLLTDEDSFDDSELGKKDSNVRLHKKRKSASPSTLDGENS